MHTVDQHILSAPIEEIAALLQRYADLCEGLKIPCDLEWVPLRPLFFTKAQSARIEEGLNAARLALKSKSVEERVLARVPERYRNFAIEHFSDAEHLRLWRPDLRGKGDALSLIDLNVGSATAVTAFETDLMNALYEDMKSSMIFGELPSARHDSIADAQAAVIERSFPDTEQILTLTAREHVGLEFVGQQEGFSEALKRASGLPLQHYVFPGEAPVREILQRKTLLYPMGQFSVNSSAQMVQLDRFLKNDQGAYFFTSPFDSLFEKWLLDNLPEDFGSVQKPATQHLSSLGTAAAKALKQNDWVLKHGDNAKVVFIGRELSEEDWQQALEHRSDHEPWLLQRFSESASVQLPFLRKGKVVFDTVIPEYSPFMLDEKLLAFFVRFVPAHSSSTIVSPPPPNLGLGVVWSVSLRTKKRAHQGLFEG